MFYGSCDLHPHAFPHWAVDALFFNVGTISELKSVLQCASVVPPFCPTVTRVVQLHFTYHCCSSNTFSPLLLRAGLFALHFPWVAGEASCGFCKRRLMKALRVWGREYLQAIRGLRSPFFGPAAWKLYFYPWLSLSVPLEPKANASILSPSDTHCFNHSNYSILAALLRISAAFLKQYFVFWSSLWNKSCLGLINLD